MFPRFDAVVVGGGPAGAFSALRLAQLGWHIALVERGVRFRNKACGHCLNLRALGVLHRARLLDTVRAICQATTHRFRVHRSNRPDIEFPLARAETNQPREGWVVPRHLFDQCLIDAASEAGVSIFQPAAAGNFRVEAGCNEVEINQAGARIPLQCGMLIGADGVGSAVARAAVNPRYLEAGRKFGFSLDLMPCQPGNLKENTIEMFIAPHGYLGIVRQDGGCVHVAGLIGIAGSPRDPFGFINELAAGQPFLKDIGMDQVSRDQVRRLCAVGPMPWRSNTMQIANESMALVGDAAGYIEPFTGEGMAWALRGAELLAESASAVAPGCWDRACAEEYIQRWQKEIATRQRICRSIAIVLENPVLERTAFGIARAFPRLTQRIIHRTVAT